LITTLLPFGCRIAIRAFAGVWKKMPGRSKASAAHVPEKWNRLSEKDMRQSNKPEDRIPILPNRDALYGPLELPTRVGSAPAALIH
jgi:hypothetical protein